MLDTVKLRSPALCEPVAVELERQCVRRSAVEINSGELLYELTTGSLEGSWDSRVSIRVEREEWVHVDREMAVRVDAVQHKQQASYRPRGGGWEVRWRKGRDRRVSHAFGGCSVKRRCEPYVLLEGSVHKALLGHNVYGGPEGFRASCEWLLDDVGQRLGVDLPPASNWLVRRVDVAEAYELPDFEAVEEYLWGLNSAQYPRRSVARYGQESIFAPGRTTAVKAYHKGVEFAKHDGRRLRGIMGLAELLELQDKANRMLRWEVSVKARKLDEDHQGKPSVEQVQDSYLEDLHYREVRRLVREGEADVEIVRRHKDVRDRLLVKYSSRKAGLLFGTWHQLVTLGERETRRHMSRPTFYRHRKELVDAGVSWIGADVLVVPRASSLPADFSPTRRDRRRHRKEHPTVSAKLAPFRAA
jgi:II/X family phage/plasmid replication protein